MNLTTLEYFIKVIEKGSIGSAADELHLSRQALSGDMVRLEEEMDSRLLLRSKNGVHPTESGRLLYQCLIDIKDKWDKTLEEMRIVRDEQRTQLSLLVSNSVFYTFPAEVFISFEESNPSISLNMNTMVMEECLKRIENGETDAAILPFPSHSGRVKNTLIAKKNAICW